MIEIIFSVIWLFIMRILSFIYLEAIRDKMIVADPAVLEKFYNIIKVSEIFFGISIVLLWIIGIYILNKGLKKIRRDCNTDLWGTICYGRIIKIFKTKSKEDNFSEQKATIAIYSNYSNSFKYIDTEICFSDKLIYKVGDYIKVKYYNDDINIISIIPKNKLPFNIRYSFKDIICEIDQQDKYQ